MATGVLISSFAWVGPPVLNAVFGFFKTSAGTQIQRLQITAQTPPVGGNITVELVDQSGTSYGAEITLPNGNSYYDFPLPAPLSLGLARIVRARFSAVDLGTASDLTLNLIGATAQGSNAPSSCCGPAECQPPTAQLLFFQGSVAQEQAAAAASAAVAALSAAAAATSETASANSASAAAVSALAAATSVGAAAASVVEAANWATNSNNAASASSVYAGQSAASAAAAAVSAAAAADSAGGAKAARLALTVASVQSIADATPTAVSWDSILFDDSAFWSAGNPSRLTIPATGVTRVRLTAGIRWTANGTGERKIKIRSNPAGIYDANSIWCSDDRPSDDNGDATVDTGIIPVTPGMYFEVLVEQDSGGPLDLNTAGADENHSNFFNLEVLKTT